MPLDVKQDHYKTRLRGTPFHERTAALNLNNDWQRWAGYTVPNSYFDVELEYFAIRNAATLYDVSPMIKYRISGAEAEAFCNRLVTRDVAKLKPGRVAYAVWCNDAGHVLDDGTVFRLGETEFRLCCQERHLDWLLDCALGFDVAVEEVTWDIAGLALQGPTSCALLRRLGLEGIGELPTVLTSFETLDEAQQLLDESGPFAQLFVWPPFYIISILGIIVGTNSAWNDAMRAARDSRVASYAGMPVATKLRLDSLGDAPTYRNGRY